jgi:hypothetical protein
MTTTDLMVAVHDAGPRTATSYPVPPAPYDPGVVGSDLTISWPVIMVTLILLPPLGALQLSHRRDVPVGLRVAIALLALVVVVMTWAGGLRLLPDS